MTSGIGFKNNFSRYEREHGSDPVELIEADLAGARRRVTLHGC